MGYDLHFTRSDHWPDSPMYPISLQEWGAVADLEPRITKHHETAYSYTNADGVNWPLGWRDGMVTIWKGGDAADELAVIAQKLGARLVGDDGEEYHPDGTYTHWTQPRPLLFRRPLNIDEAAPAWATIFDRDFEDGYSWRPGPGHAGHALSAFRTFAGREVATADVPDTDGLLYRYGEDGPRFRLTFARQVAADSGGGPIRVECRLDYPSGGGLAGLEPFHQWWFPDQTRDQWFDGLAARPEWPILDALTPLAVDFGRWPGGPEASG